MKPLIPHLPKSPGTPRQCTGIPHKNILPVKVVSKLQHHALHLPFATVVYPYIIRFYHRQDNIVIGCVPMVTVIVPITAFQMNLHIHAIEAGNQCRKHQDYRQPCHAFHDCIHIIRDNRDEGIHCSRENVNVAGIISRFHLQCLPGSILFCKKTETSFARLL